MTVIEQVSTQLSLEEALRLEMQESYTDVFYQKAKELIDTYNLKWTPSLKANGVWLVAKDVELAKGNRGDQFKRNYNSTVGRINYSLLPLKPQKHQLIGDNLRRFKSTWKAIHGEDLGSINKLWILNISAALCYLQPEAIKKNNVVQLNNKKACACTSVKDDSLGLGLGLEDFASWQKYAESYEDFEPAPKVELQVDFELTKEEQLGERLALLSTYTSTPFTREYTVVNTIDSNTKTRRYDFVRNHIGIWEIYELKLGQLTLEDITQTLATKAYLELAAQNFENTQFWFLAQGITKEAERMLNLIPQVNFITVKELVEQLIDQAYTDCPSAGRWFVKQRIKPQFQDLLN